jgi:hypothetical protein
MHIYSAQMTAAVGSQMETAGHITRTRDVASAATGLTISAWATIVGAPSGSFALSMRVDGMAQLVEATAKLAGDEAWAALADDSARLFAGPAEIGFQNVIAATTEEMASPALVAINRSQIAAGQIKAAVERSAEMLNAIKEVTGIDGMLTMSDGGTSNELAFIFGVDSAEAADAANAALAADPTWLDMMDSAGHLFTSGSSHRTYAARMP